MSLEITNKHFKYDFKAPTSYAFHALVLNYFVKNVLSKRKDKTSVQIYFRLFRAGIIGDILYKAGEGQVEDIESEVNSEILAALFEGYLALARSIYDYLLIFLKEQYGVEQTSFNDFIKKVKQGKYEGIDEKFKRHLDNKLFSDLRNLRNSVIHKTANLFVYVKEKKYRIEGTIYRDDKTKESLDESLYLLVFGYTTSLLLLMSYIAEKETGKTLKEQLELRDSETKISSS